MTKSINVVLAALFTIAIMLVALSTATPVTVNAQEEPQATQTSAEEQSSDQEGAYFFTAQTGDSYSKIVRKAVQIYGIDNNVVLSGEQIVFAETNLTQEAGSPELNEGQAVSISKDSVKSWVDKANELSDTQQAAWTIYVTNVDFNTDNVGE